MTVRNANQIRPTHLPIYCSACLGQYPNRRHVDFDAECDRGYAETIVQGKSQGEPISQLPIQMDDLILCEDCLRNGAEVIGMIDGKSLEAELEALKRKNELLEKRAEKAENYADRLEEGLTKLREKPVRVDHRQKPRRTPDLEGVA
jgi:hypothetical protein